jgi:hypothetical protein
MDRYTESTGAGSSLPHPSTVTHIVLRAYGLARPEDAYPSERSHAGHVKHRVLVLGAGVGGLELSCLLSERLTDEVEVVLIDQSDAFVFGFSKLDLLFGNRSRGGAAALPPCWRDRAWSFSRSRSCRSTHWRAWW